MQYSVVLDQLCKQFGNVQAVNNISARIPAGSIYGFLGPNGAGKTTTIRMIMSILYPDSGSITLLGSSDPESVKDSLGYLPEEKGLYKKMKTLDLIAYFGRLKGMSKRDARRTALKLLEQFGLADWAEQKCDSLSKGMAQKLQIISTLMHEPELLILDEPFSGLDPINVDMVREVILDLKKQGKTVIFSTHVMEQAEQICDYILLINAGEKILDGTLAEVKGSGHETITIDYEGDAAIFNQIDSIVRIQDMGRTAELSIAEGADPGSILKQLVDHLSISRFEVKEPSLHEVFVRAVENSNA